MIEGVFIKKHWMIDELMKNPNAFTALIYMKLHESKEAMFGLKKGEVKITRELLKMSNADYRQVKKNLEEWNLAKFRSTNKFTVGRITNNELFANE